ncbi:MAG: ABC transporter ATP-binding protein [Candidatus Hodarchaeales archaeon]
MSVILNQVTRKFGNFTAVNELTLQIYPGEIFGFMGPNGAGKTTILRMIGAILQPTSGIITVNGNDTVKHPDMVKHETGLLPETGGLYRRLTAAEYLQLIGSLYSIPYSIARERISEQLDYLQFHEHDSMLEELSRGMRQKVMIVATLINDPNVVLLDEPIATLDPVIAFKVKQLIKELVKREKTVIVSSHNPSLIEELASRVSFISHGKTIAIGSPNELKNTYGSENLEGCYMKALG